MPSVRTPWDTVSQDGFSKVLPFHLSGAFGGQRGRFNPYQTSRWVRQGRNLYSHRTDNESCSETL